jgi:electron transfer flavoprotein beta subunit
VLTVKEGINLPRYPSLPGRMRARKAQIHEFEPAWQASAVQKVALRVPNVARQRAEIIGTGLDGVPALLALLDQLGVLA